MSQYVFFHGFVHAVDTRALVIGFSGQVVLLAKPVEDFFLKLGKFSFDTLDDLLVAFID